MVYYKNNRLKCIERMREYNKKYIRKSIKPVKIIVNRNKIYVNFD